MLPDATIEASNLVAGVIAADGRLTDSELDAYLDSIGPLLDPPLITTASHVRDTDLFRHRDDWLAGPSMLFDLLVRADGRYGTRRSNRYYELAMRLAHVTAATDLNPSVDELQAIDTYRTTLLHAMDAAGVARPGQPDAAPRPAPADDAPAAVPTAEAHKPAAAPDADTSTGTIGRRADGRARRVDRPRQRQGRGAPPDQHVASATDPRRARAAGDRDQSSPRVHRQPRNRQDDRGAAAQPDLPRRRRRLARAISSRPTVPSSSPASSARRRSRRSRRCRPRWAGCC